jgi:16S rRNA processing protein RimM
MKTEANNLVIMGRVVAPYGVLGWLKVLPDTELIDGLFDYKRWWVGKGKDWREVKVNAGKVHNDVLLVKLEGVNDREAALACKGQQIAVPRDALPTLAEDEVYWSDLIGLIVRNQQDIEFGKIVDVFETGANDVIVVQGDIERLIPYTAQTVIDVNVAQQSMLVDWDKDY